jgi:hypothetical protein
MVKDIIDNIGNWQSLLADGKPLFLTKELKITYMDLKRIGFNRIISLFNV